MVVCMSSIWRPSNPWSLTLVIPIEEYPRIFGHSAETISRTVIRQFGKDHDDAACVALCYEQ